MDVVEVEPQRRAPVLLALGVMLAVSLVAAGGVLAWARLAAPAAVAEEGRPGLNEQLPAQLADGRPFAEVPPEIVAAVQAPVVGAERFDTVPEELADCAGMPVEDLTFESGFVTADGAIAASTGEAEDFGREGAGDIRTVCTGRWTGAAWQVDGSTVEELSGGGSGTSSWGGEGGWMTAMATLDLPEGAAWVVQDRGGYRLAYPVEGLTALPLSWRFREGPFGGGRPPATAVTLLDDEGDVLEETLVGS